MYISRAIHYIYGFLTLLQEVGVFFGVKSDAQTEGLAYNESG